MSQFMADLYLLLKELNLVRYPSDVYLVVIGFQVLLVFGLGLISEWAISTIFGPTPQPERSGPGGEPAQPPGAL